MPQFDIASFYSQTTFFAGTFLLFYAFLCKNILPKTSQNIKLNKRIASIYNVFAAGQKDIKDLPGYIYVPKTQMQLHAIYKETICLLHSHQFLRILTLSHISCLNWLVNIQNKNSRIKLLKLSTLYLCALSDIF